MKFCEWTVFTKLFFFITYEWLNKIACILRLRFTGACECSFTRMKMSLSDGEVLLAMDRIFLNSLCLAIT